MTGRPPGGMSGPPRGPMSLSGWHSWLGNDVGTVVILTIAALPLAVLAAWALARRRRRLGLAPAWAWRASLAEVAIVYGTAPWVLMTLLPGSGIGGGAGRVDLVPFSDVPSMPAYQVVGNLLVFAALGFVGPVRFRALASLGRVLVVASTASVLIEAAQHLLGLGRVSSVDDVLLNTTGAVLAAIASRRWWEGRSGAPCEPPLVGPDRLLV